MAMTATTADIDEHTQEGGWCQKDQSIGIPSISLQLPFSLISSLHEAPAGKSCPFTATDDEGQLLVSYKHDKVIGSTGVHLYTVNRKI